MARLHGMDLKPGQLHTLVKELCTTQSLSPAEAKEVSYLDLQNNPQTIEQPLPNDPKDLFVTCVRCHSAGKIHSYRMTASAWDKLVDFHLYMYPTVVYQMREMRWVPNARAMVRELAKTQPYGDDWVAPKQTPVGSWLILGHQPAKGDYLGHASIKAAPEGGYEIAGSLAYADGSQQTFRGSATLYGGSALRTHVNVDGFKAEGAYTLVKDTLHGVRSFSAPDYRTSVSSWYRESNQAQVLRVSPNYLVSGETTTVRLEGMNLPQVTASSLHVADVDVKVLSARRINSSLIEAQVVYGGHGAYKGNLKVNGMTAGELNLVPQIDYIKVTPQMGRARVYGGQKFPAEGVQFEAIAYSNGNNALDPADDVELGPVPASFKLSEDVTRPGDDDLRYVGEIESDGTYIPVGTYEPIPARKYSREGVGMVYVNAQYDRAGNR
jgi:quinohemoprotein amine dehydrogenase